MGIKDSNTCVTVIKSEIIERTYGKTSLLKAILIYMSEYWADTGTNLHTCLRWNSDQEWVTVATVVQNRRWGSAHYLAANPTSRPTSEKEKIIQS